MVSTVHFSETLTYDICGSVKGVIIDKFHHHANSDGQSVQQRGLDEDSADDTETFSSAKPPQFHALRRRLSPQ